MTAWLILRTFTYFAFPACAWAGLVWADAIPRGRRGWPTHAVMAGLVILAAWIGVTP